MNLENISDSLKNCHFVEEAAEYFITSILVIHKYTLASQETSYNAGVQASPYSG